jgi:hypothetical protein
VNREKRDQSAEKIPLPKDVFASTWESIFNLTGVQKKINLTGKPLVERI